MPSNIWYRSIFLHLLSNLLIPRYHTTLCTGLWQICLTLELLLFPLTDQSNHDHNSGQQVPEAKIFKDEELVNMIDPILASDDKNRDGYIDWRVLVLGNFLQVEKLFCSLQSLGGEEQVPEGVPQGTGCPGHYPER